ncbi:MAG: hypothetical protein V7K14_20420 [Nostoc sp.]|uniref:hypothetical protein n=1 Tax=Nostoc sp. TaxID=1180 RepID=UPI002FF445F5
MGGDGGDGGDEGDEGDEGDKGDKRNAQYPILLYERLRQRLLYETLFAFAQYKCPMPHVPCTMTNDQ